MDKILKIQSEIGVLAKTETNPFFKSKYFDVNSLIAQLLPLLEKHGLTVIQPLTFISCWEPGVGSRGVHPALKTMVFDGDKKVIDEAIPLPDIQDPQKMGSAITYYRRYALQSLFLLQAEDDDGEKAKPTAPVKKTPVKIDPKEAKKNASQAIADVKNLDTLMEVEKNISKSKNLTSEDKEELLFLASEKRMEFDPTK